MVETYVKDEGNIVNEEGLLMEATEKEKSWETLWRRILGLSV